MEPPYARDAVADGAPIAFFDGECGMCTRWVSWTLARDRRGVLRFAPLQGRTYAALGRPATAGPYDTLVLLDDDGLHERSTAIARMLAALGGPWRVAGALLRAVPRPCRDFAYDFVAKRRRGWFAAPPTCALHSGAQAERFLP